MDPDSVDNFIEFSVSTIVLCNIYKYLTPQSFSSFHQLVLPKKGNSAEIERSLMPCERVVFS